MQLWNRKLVIVLLLLASGLATPSVWAHELSFAYTYESTTQPAGSWELENWVTWATHKAEDHDFDQIAFRHELEFGVTDNLQLGFYLSEWDYQDGVSAEHHGTRWNDAAVEAIYSLTDSVNDP